MKHMISSFNMEGEVISEHFLMLWFQKDSLETVGFRTFMTWVGGAENFIFHVCPFDREWGRGGSKTIWAMPI